MYSKVNNTVMQSSFRVSFHTAFSAPFGTRSRRHVHQWDLPLQVQVHTVSTQRISQRQEALLLGSLEAMAALFSWPSQMRLR